MKTKEKIFNIIEDFTDEQLEDLLTMLQSIKNIIDKAKK